MNPLSWFREFRLRKEDIETLLDKVEELKRKLAKCKDTKEVSS